MLILRDIRGVPVVSSVQDIRGVLIAYISRQAMTPQPTALLDMTARIYMPDEKPLKSLSDKF